MSDLRVAIFGDVVGSLGRRAVAHSIPRLRTEKGVRIFIANGENSRNGSGLSPDNFRELIRSGVDVVTLGDHWIKDRQITSYLENEHEPVARPANLADASPGKHFSLIRKDGLPPIAVVTVLGRIFMPIPSDNPFIAVDREMAEIAKVAPNALVVVELHGETTSEKQAMAWYALDKHTDGPGLGSLPSSARTRMCRPPTPGSSITALPRSPTSACAARTAASLAAMFRPRSTPWSARPRARSMSRATTTAPAA